MINSLLSRINNIYRIGALALFFKSCSVVAVEPVSPSGPNLLDTLPREQPSGMIPLREIDKRGLVSYEGDIKAVHPAERLVVVQGWILPKRITDPKALQFHCPS